MNKTVNINLAGISYQIDEDAYAKLQRYLAAIKRSFTGAQGHDEIMADIEARIAELFGEKMSHERQVIGLKELDEVIEVMGQPEDYAIDEEIFEDEPVYQREPRRVRKLYRDTENAYIGGVSSGLGHYLGIDPIWLRIAWVLFTILSTGAFILIYIVFWIFMPEAISTSEKLAMRGKAANIDNIQRKVKERFENVSDSVRSVDYEKYGNKAKSGAKGFFNTLGDIILFLLKVFVKFIGILLILIGATTVIGLFVGLFTAGTIGFYGGDFMDYVHVVNTTGVPLWLVSLLTFFAVGIPFFLVFYLGLKILVGNLKRMTLAGKLTLLGVWLISVLALGVIGIRQAVNYSSEGEVATEYPLDIAAMDTLTVRMVGSDVYNDRLRRSGDIRIGNNSEGNKTLYGRDVRLVVRSSRDSVAKLEIAKIASGVDYGLAQERAEAVDYNFRMEGNTLLLDGFFQTPALNKFRDQEVTIFLYLPEGTVLFADDNTRSFHRNPSSYHDILDTGMEENYLTVSNGRLECDDCPQNRWESRDGEDSVQYREYEEGDEIPDWERDDDAPRALGTPEPTPAPEEETTDTIQ